MTKLNWNRNNYSSILNSDYYKNPKQGFDKHWHYNQTLHNQKLEKIKKQHIDLGIHQEHQLEIVETDSGPHAGKLICVTCTKFLRWLPKEFFT